MNDKWVEERQKLAIEALKMLSDPTIDQRQYFKFVSLLKRLGIDHKGPVFEIYETLRRMEQGL